MINLLNIMKKLVPTALSGHNGLMHAKPIFIVLVAMSFFITVLMNVIDGARVSAQTLPDTSPALSVLPTPDPTEEASWLRLPDLPPDATQADVGAEIYRLVCRDCHGDKGQGLTKDWIATWDPSDQNCWQAKCHASNHPPEGFVLPRYVPPLMGATALARFETSSELYDYMHQSMPFHNPGSLQEREYWQLAAFIVRENGLDLPTNTLDRDNAVILHAQADDTAVTLPTATATAPKELSQSTTNWPFDSWIWFFIALMLVASVIFAVAHLA